MNDGRKDGTGDRIFGKGDFPGMRLTSTPLVPYPLMYIHFPEGKEAELRQAMKSRANPPWRYIPQNEQWHWEEEGYLRIDWDEPHGFLFECCVHPAGPGKLSLNACRKVEIQIRMPLEEWVRLLQEFIAAIGKPAAESVGGWVEFDPQQGS